jgi:hypothetical protein
MRFTGRITPTKLFALILTILGFVATIVLKDITPFVIASPLSAGLLGYRQHSNSKVDLKHGRVNEKA